MAIGGPLVFAGGCPQLGGHKQHATVRTTSCRVSLHAASARRPSSAAAQQGFHRHCNWAMGKTPGAFIALRRYRMAYVTKAAGSGAGDEAASDSKGDDEAEAKEVAAQAEAPLDDAKEIAAASEWDTSACLTPRAILCGLSIGSCIAAMNVSLGLKTGWGQGGSVTAAVAAFAIFQALKPSLPFTRYEVNIAQTCASACGTMVAAGGLTSAIPALSLLGVTKTVPALIGFSLSIAFLGCFFGVPLRKPMVVEGGYPFPEGTTTFNTIEALYASGQEAKAKASVLLRWFLGSAAFTIGKYFAPVLPSSVPVPAGPRLAPFGFAFEIDPMLLSIGMLVGPSTAAAIGIGAIAAWGVMAPAVQSLGLVSGPAMAMTGARGFILWPGIVLLTAGAVVQLVIALVELFASKSDAGKEGVAEAAEDHPDQVPDSVLKWGLAAAAAGAVVSMKIAFGLPMWQTAVSLLLSTVLSYVAVRCVGEININPIGGVGKVAQLLFSVIAPGNTVANVMQATVAAAGASQAGDMSTDFKTGYLLKASPWKQFQAQLIGVPFGAIMSVAAYKLFEGAYGIGSEQCPAPAALAWKGVAELLANGLGSLPEGTTGVCAGAAVVSVVLSVAQRLFGAKPWGRWIPSPLALGIAFLIPASASITIAAGGILAALWGAIQPEQRALYGQEVGSGLLAGSGVAAVVVAVLTLLSVPPLITA